MNHSNTLRVHTEMVRAALFCKKTDGYRLLLLQRAQTQPMAGYWELPGGKIESGESPEQAIVREVLEETGLTFSKQRLLWTRPRLSGKQLPQYFFVGRADTTIVKLSSEHDSFVWSPIAEIWHYLLSKPSAQFLQKKIIKFETAEN